MKNRREREYYIISTINSYQQGWYIFGGPFDNRQEAEKEMDTFFAGNDIYEDTLCKNARVIPRSSLRNFGIKEEYMELCWAENFE